MAQSYGKWHLCHDLSWPRQELEAGVESPNDADFFVMLIVFSTVGQMATVVMLFLAAGLPVLVAKFDLSKAYKRVGTQAALLWRRTCWSEEGSQTLDRVAFGQRDGPSIFSRHSTHMVYVMRMELAFADACYPPRDPAVIAFILARLALAVASGVADARAWASLFLVIAMIDDFGLVSVNDLLFRCDGSRVLRSDGQQMRRAEMHFTICCSIALRFGHALERDDPAKYVPPCLLLLYLGIVIDVAAGELTFDAAKRSAYAVRLRAALSEPSCSAKAFLSLSFRMLVVCEVWPYARPWCAPLFRAVRGDRRTAVIFAREPAVESALRRFLALLEGEQRLAIPLASRVYFPFADAEHLLVSFADASGPEPPWRPQIGSPGFGAWAVRGRTLYYFHGLWQPCEAETLSINVLEYLVSFWATVLLSEAHPSVSHLLEFTDNTAAEWSMRRETPSARLMQIVSERRAAYMQRRGLFSRVSRVDSSANRWADMLSRQRVADVLAEAAALGLSCVELRMPPELRDTLWLTREGA